MCEEGSLSHQEALRFRGLARVDLAKLNFEYALSQGHRNLEQRNVKRLLGIFRTHGCERYESANFVKARVDAGSLDAALTSQGFRLPQQPPDSWQAIPILQVSSIDCLNGLHRVLAARKYLDLNDQWWIARLYTEGWVFEAFFLLAMLTGVQTSHSFARETWWRSTPMSRLLLTARSFARSDCVTRAVTKMASESGGPDFRRTRGRICDSSCAMRNSPTRPMPCSLGRDCFTPCPPEVCGGP